MKSHFTLPLAALAGILPLTASASAQTAANSPPATTPASTDPAAAPVQAAPEMTPPAKPAKKSRKSRDAATATPATPAAAPGPAPATANQIADGQVQNQAAPATRPAPTAPATPTTAGPGTAPAAPATTAAPAAPASTAPNPDVGGAKMDAAKTIVANAATAPNLTTLVKAVQAAGLAETLSGPGPFTVFAPTNDAFGRLAPGTVDTLLKPANKPLLVKALTYHVVPGNISATQLLEQVTAGSGKATLTTVEGSPLTVTKEAEAIVLTDVNGNKSYIETPDVRQSNGVVHVVNGVVLPKLN